MTRSNISGTTFRTAFVLLLVLAISALFVAVAWPFLKPLLLGAMLAGLFRPLYLWVAKMVRGRGSLAAGLTLVLLFLIVAGPVSAFVGVVVRQAIRITEQAIPWVRQHLGTALEFDPHAWAMERMPLMAPYLPDQQQIIDGIGVVATSAGAFLVTGASRMTVGTAGFLLDLFVMLYALFFFLRDGRQILERIFYYTPLDHHDEAMVLERLASVTRATIKGTLVIGIIQGTLAGLGFWAAGIDGAAFWGTIMTILSIVPGVGAALVWIPGVIYLYATGQALAATLLLVWCAAVVGTVDNILRPRLVGKDAKMPDLLILVGTLGGLFLFGPIGFIVGPIVCGLFLTVWDIYGTTFRDILPPVRSLRTGETRRDPPTLEEKVGGPRPDSPSR